MGVINKYGGLRCYFETENSIRTTDKTRRLREINTVKRRGPED